MRFNISAHRGLSVGFFPASSADVVTMFAHVLQGKPLALLGLGLARSSPFFEAFQPRAVCGSPPIWANYEEEDRLHASHGLGRFRFGPSTTCFVGGGAPRPHTLEQLRGPAGPCEAVVETWGSYEQFQIATGREGVYSLGRPSVRDWRLRSFGPYAAYPRSTPNPSPSLP